MIRPAAKTTGGLELPGKVTVETPAKRDDIDEQRVWFRLTVNISDGSVAGRGESCGSSNLL
jgi:hypothetical protein